MHKLRQFITAFACLFETITKGKYMINKHKQIIDFARGKIVLVNLQA